MNPREIELPVDLPRKFEVVRHRIGLVFGISIIALVIFLLFLLSFFLGLTLAKGVAALPDIRSLENWQPNQSTRIFDRNGDLIANIHGDEDRVVVPLSDISPNIQRAVMAIEDNRFYEHGGIDVRGTFRALAQNAKGSDVQGGSTLTQQLVKNLFLTPERSVGRKIAEALLSMRVEKYYKKNKILELYLNQVYWGNQAYGIEKAARRYFKEPASELTIAQSALLAGLLKAPEGLSPFNYPEAARKRQLEVLNAMVEFGYITPEQRKQAEEEPIKLNSRIPKPSKYPYFVAHVVHELNRIFGEDVVRRGGLKVYTTLDREAQEAAEKALTDKMTSLPKYTNVTQGAFVAIDVPTAEILAIVGGLDFEKNQFNNATQALRPVGSTFKPAVYSTGFRLGVITPDSPISDRPVFFNTGYGIWSPHNWDGKYMGPMTVRRALTLSRNTTTVQVGMKVGIHEVIKTAAMLGLPADRIEPNFSSLLGSSVFTPLEMATMYSTIARNGILMHPTVLRRVETMDGREVPIERPTPDTKNGSMDPNVIANLVSILIDVVEKGTGKNAMLHDRVVAGKTGTTDKVRDIWFNGFTPDLEACVWMGNEANLPLKSVFSSDAAQVWHDFAVKYYQTRNIPPSDFPKPRPLDGHAKSSVVLNLNPETPKPVSPENQPPSPNDVPGGGPQPPSSAPVTAFGPPAAPSAVSSPQSPTLSAPISGPPVPGPVESEKNRRASD